jgi:hypothetical protein
MRLPPLLLTRSWLLSGNPELNAVLPTAVIAAGYGWCLIAMWSDVPGDD